MYEFEIHKADGLVSKSHLNELGEAGWQLCAVIPVEDEGQTQLHYIFQRQKGLRFQSHQILG